MVPEFNRDARQPSRQSQRALFTPTWLAHPEVQAKRETDVGVENQRNQVRNMLYQRRFEEELPIWLRKIPPEACRDQIMMQRSAITSGEPGASALTGSNRAAKSRLRADCDWRPAVVLRAR